MKILYVSKYAAFGNSPKPTRQYFISRALADLGCEVTIIGSRSNGLSSPSFSGFSHRLTEGRLTTVLLNGPIVDFGVNAKRLFSWLLFELLLLLQLPRLRRTRPDVLIVSSLSAFTLLTGVLLKKLLGVRLAVEIRDIYPLTLVEVGGWSPRNPLVRILAWIERTAYRAADVVFSPLENLEAHTRCISGNDVPFVWIPMGYDPGPSSAQLSSPGKHAAGALIELAAQGRFSVVYAGTIGMANELQTLLEIAPEALPAHVQLVIIGDGPLKQELARRYASSGNVTFLDPIPKADVVEVLSYAGLLVTPVKNAPIYRFGVSPNKWIDYGLSGRPFLTNLQARLEVIRLSPNVFVTEDASSAALARAIMRISTMPKAELDRMGTAGREYVIENLSYSTLAAKLLTTLRSVVVPA